MPSATLTFLRDARWLNAERLRGYSLILLGVSAAGFLVWVALSHGLIDRTGKPLGTDFMSFYAAGKQTLTGRAAEAWSPQAHHAVENAIFGRDLGDWAFFYPPAYLLVCVPLALLPYGAALIVWLSATTATMLALVRSWLRRLSDAPVLMPLLAFPALWINLGNGQNAALTTAIFTSGALLLPKRPWLAGAVFGLLIIKPQLGLALPVLLAASGRWKTFAGAALSALGLSLLALPVVGMDGYIAFLRNMSLAHATLDQGLVPPSSMVSLFAAVRTLGGNAGFAYAAQGVVALCVLAVAAWVVWRYRPGAPAFCALLAAATLLISPFLLDYDLLLAALPLGWLIVQGAQTGFRPWEKLLLLGACLTPLLARSLAANLHLPIAPIMMLALFVLIVRRIQAPAPVAAAHLRPAHA
ncbi:MAG TPA: glycosyltransferase family 87 protein [Asticcacaulis sp.]|nr:glycosyltransferase family 87 protein [Asticcacaulis sp.]